MKRIAIGAKRHRLGLSVQVCVWMRRPQGGASQLCHRLSTRANGSLRSTLHVIRHIRYEGEGGVRITNQQKVRLINSHANWLAEMHSCTLQASHLYNIYIYIYRYRTQAPVWSLHHYPLQFLTFPDIQITPLFPCPTLLLSAREVWLISIWSIFPMV